MAQEAPPAGWVRDHLANERTLLAWIRTALAFMAAGVALAKLTYLLHDELIDHPDLRLELPSPERAKAVGVTLIMFGGAIAAAGMIKTRRWARRINPAYRPPTHRTLWTIAFLTTVLAFALALYVLF